MPILASGTTNMGLTTYRQNFTVIIPYGILPRDHLLVTNELTSSCMDRTIVHKIKKYVHYIK